MKKANVSIIITTFNRKDILEKSFGLIKRQSVLAENTVEVIVADDGSTDGTDCFVKEYAKTSPFPVRFLTSGLTNLFGAACARNLAIGDSQGDYLCFLDDDCMPHYRWLESYLDMFEKGADVMIGNVTHSEAALAEEKISIDRDDMQRLFDESNKGALTEFLTGNCAIRRNCVDRAGMFDERFVQAGGYGYEDIEFGHRLLIAGYRIYFNKDALAYTPVKSATIAQERSEKKKQAKLLWWHIIMHPQENLPITPELHMYAKKRQAELDALGT